MRIFDIQIPTDTVRVHAGGETSATFTVTNRSGRTLRGLVHLLPQGACQQEWLSVQGPSTIEFEEGASQQVEIGVSPPPDAEPGTHKFSLILASEENPDEDYVEGVVQFDVAEARPVPEKKPRWPLFAAIAAGVLVLIGLGILLATMLGGKPETFPLPPLEGQARSEAVTLLEALHLKADIQEEENTEKPPEEVLHQDPPPDTQVSRGDTITLVVATRPGAQQVEVPPVEGQSLEFAKGALETRGFRVRAVLETKKQPEAGSGLERNLESMRRPRTTVRETVATKMFRIKNLDALSAAQIRRIDGKVIRQKPEAHQKAPEGSTVTVTIHQD